MSEDRKIYLTKEIVNWVNSLNWKDYNNYLKLVKLLAENGIILDVK